MINVCPSCGAFCDALDTTTGWCSSCALETIIDAKRCRTCDILKPLDDFLPRRDGTRNECRQCESIRRQLWREHNRERDREQDRIRARRRREATTRAAS